MRPIRRPWRIIARLAAVAWLLAGTPAANAFYWHNWPGSLETSPSETATTTTTTPTTTTTGGGTQTQTGSPGNGPDVSGSGGTSGAPHVPEPSTALAGLIGLTAIGLLRWTHCRRASTARQR